MQDIEDEFAFLGDWEERYRHVIELGKAMPALPIALKTDASKIQGCVSQVWLVAKRQDAGTYSFSGDSDAHIVRGLVALLLLLIEGKTGAEILNMDIRGFFERIGLADNLSPQRANGLNAMIRRVQDIASQAQ
ncbi:Sulfur acceptor protein =_ iron-sulfur cluster assembly SufE [hydrothermal vent metagenome]|uniref:Sulfur acceptor protein => iron-sulfur cluster assembly SufE n=1 Tax=hydrothermal vent metagenome TaxID=652676 RepID=A0A3B0S2P8_9ZZZZ